MKKIFSLLCAVVIAASAMAQRSEKIFFIGYLVFMVFRCLL